MLLLSYLKICLINILRINIVLWLGFRKKKKLTPCLLSNKTHRFSSYKK